MQPILFLIAATGLCSCSRSAADRSFYTAAVFEHARVANEKFSPEYIVDSNLLFYEKATEIAKSKGANIIVFPEYGLFPPSSDKDTLKEFAEAIPEGFPYITVPCDRNAEFSQRQILRRLSCMSKNSSLTVVANMLDVLDCRDLTGCPSDGVAVYSTNVMFDANGVLMLRYRKASVPEGNAIELTQDPVFVTNFGTFSMSTGSDVDFGKMGNDSGVDAVAFPVAWKEQPPQKTSLQVFESWAIEQNVTLLVANLNIPGSYSVGSGIFNARAGALAYTYNPDGISKLVVAAVPKNGALLGSPNNSITAITSNKTWELTTDGDGVAEECSELLLGPSDGDYRCLQENTADYTFVPLTDNIGKVEACNNGMCCSASYISNSLHETFFLGAYNAHGLDPEGSCEESCVLTACESFNNATCAVFPRKAITLFMKIELRANFTVQDVYPSLLDGGMRLLPRTEWTDGPCDGSDSGRCLSFESQSGRNVISAGMRGRCDERHITTTTEPSTASVSHSQSTTIMILSIVLFLHFVY